MLSKNNTQYEELTEPLVCLHMPSIIRGCISILPQLLLQKHSPKCQHFYLCVYRKISWDKQPENQDRSESVVGFISEGKV